MSRRHGLAFEKTDGGRLDAGFKGSAGDCATRAITLYTGENYRTIYNELTHLTRKLTGGFDRSVRDGVGLPTFYHYMTQTLEATPMLTPGSYFTADAIPDGPLIAVLPRHFVFVENHTVFDAWDSRHSSRTKNGANRLLGFFY